MLVRFNQNLMPITHEENYIYYNNSCNYFPTLSEFVTNLDECVSHYRPSLRYRREIITRYNQPVNIIRDMETQLFASQKDYNNAAIKETLVKFIYPILRNVAPFLCQLIYLKYNDAKNTAINNNSKPHIEMNKIIDLYPIKPNMNEYSMNKQKL